MSAQPPYPPPPPPKTGLSTRTTAMLLLVVAFALTGGVYLYKTSLDSHAASVRGLEDSITSSAQNQGLNVTKTDCNETSSSGTYDCIAVTGTDSDGTQHGLRYTGTIDNGEIRWRIGD